MWNCGRLKSYNETTCRALWTKSCAARSARDWTTKLVQPTVQWTLYRNRQTSVLLLVIPPIRWRIESRCQNSCLSAQPALHREVSLLRGFAQHLQRFLLHCASQHLFSSEEAFLRVSGCRARRQNGSFLGTPLAIVLPEQARVVTSRYVLLPMEDFPRLSTFFPSIPKI